jgi:hypothetical protein
LPSLTGSVEKPIIFIDRTDLFSKSESAMNITPNDLTEFTGTEHYFQTIDKSIVYTDGFQYFARNAGDHGAYWLLDLIVLDLIPANRDEEFLVVEVTVKNGQAVTRTQDGNDNYFLTIRIEYTDLAEGDWKFYVENGMVGDKEFKVILLPSEH